MYVINCSIPSILYIIIPLLCCCCFLRRIYIDSIDREELFFLPFCARPPHYSPYLDQNDNDYLRLTAAAAVARPVWLTTLCIYIFSLNCNKTSHSEERRGIRGGKIFFHPREVVTSQRRRRRPEKRWEQLELAIVGALDFHSSAHAFTFVVFFYVQEWNMNFPCGIFPSHRQLLLDEWNLWSSASLLNAYSVEIELTMPKRKHLIKKCAVFNLFRRRFSSQFKPRRRLD